MQNVLTVVAQAILPVLLIFFVSLFMPYSVIAQMPALPPQQSTKGSVDPQKALTEYMLSVWTAEQGLPQNSAIALCQTRDGYLWIGTQEGLARFDGAHFVVLEKSNTPAITNNYITALLEDREGALWIGTNGGGLCCLKNGAFTTFTTKNGLPNNIIRSIIQDRSGALWIGTNGGGVCQMSNGGFTTYSSKNGLSNDVVYTMIQAHDDALWFGTLGGGVCRFKDGTFTTYSTKNGLSNDIIRSLLQDRDGSVWIGTNGGGLNRFKDGVLTAFTTHNGLSNDRVYALLQDNEGTLWVGTLGGGLNRYTNGVFEAFTTKNGLSSDNIRTLLQDRDGALLIGTGGGGLCRLKDAAFVSYSTRNGLSHDFVHAVREGNDGSVWIATSKGANHLTHGVFTTTYTAQNGLPSDGTLSLLQDRSGGLWFGTSGGLGYMKNGKFITYTTKNGLAHDGVQVLLQDRDGALWVGTNGGGLNHFHNGKWTTYSTKDGLAHDAVYALMQDRDGALWAGTGGGGLSHFKNGVWTSYTTKNGLSHNVVYTLLQDRSGAVWVGTNGGGLNRLKDGKITAVTTKEGLFNDVVYCVLEDDYGYLWASCNKGVYRMNKRDVDDVADGKIPRFSCQNFGVANGMISVECNGGTNPAGWKAADGRLWFPTVKGVVVADPRKVATNLLAPTVILETFLVNDHDSISNIPLLKKLPEKAGEKTGEKTSSELELPSRSDKIEFHYTAPWFIAPERVKFSYILEGYDKGWVNAGTRRVAYYNNLPRGKRYVFRVKACNQDEVWSNEDAAAVFSLKPFFWETTWFYGLCVVFVFGSGYGVYRWRLWQVQRRAQILELKVAERSEELRISNELARQVNATFDVDAIMQTILSTLAASREFSAFTSISIHLYQVESQTLTFYKGYGEIAKPESMAKMGEVVFSVPKKESLTTYVVAQNKHFYAPYVVPAMLYPTDRNLYNIFKFTSAVLYPLEVGGRVIGTANFYTTTQYKRLNTAQVQKFGMYVTQIAAAINNARLYEELRQHEAELSEMNELARRVNAKLDIEAIVETVLSALATVSEFTDFTTISITLFDPKEDTLKFYAMQGALVTQNVLDYIGTKKLSVTGKDSIATYVFSKKKSFYVPFANPTEMQPADRGLYEQMHFSSVVMYPLVVQDESIGTVQFYTSGKIHPLQPSQVEKFGVYVTQIASAINNARLYDELHQQEAELREINADIHRRNAILGAAASTLDLDILMERVLAVLRERFTFDRVIIQVVHEEDQTLDIYGVYGENLTPEVAKKYRAVRIPLHEQQSLTTVVIHQKQPLYIRHLCPDDAMLPTDRDMYEISDLTSFISFPLETAIGLEGCILFISTTQPTDLSNDDIEFLNAVSKQLSGSLSNAILYEQSLQDRDEITRQMEIQSEQAREIELANSALQQAHQESETLLLNILPAPIARRLKSGERAIAERFESVTVLFADIVGFTKLSARTTPEELVKGLNAIFGRFDALAKEFGLEKIKTIGDAYMVAGGLPERSEDHAERVARFALEIQAVMQEEALRTSKGEQVQLRIGIHTGEAVAGVIGTSKFSYDLWGDTVNTASRMESHGEAGKIHVSEEVYRALRGHQSLDIGHWSNDNPKAPITKQPITKQPMTNDQSTNDQVTNGFLFEERGGIEVKGKGMMRTWFLIGAN